jgi:hypothetical protein
VDQWWIRSFGIAVWAPATKYRLEKENQLEPYRPPDRLPNDVFIGSSGRSSSLSLQAKNEKGRDTAKRAR